MLDEGISSSFLLFSKFYHFCSLNSLWACSFLSVSFFHPVPIRYHLLSEIMCQPAKQSLFHKSCSTPFHVIHNSKTVALKHGSDHIDPIFKGFPSALKMKFKIPTMSGSFFLSVPLPSHSPDRSLSFPRLQPFWASGLLNMPQYLKFFPFICCSFCLKYLLSPTPIPLSFI